MWSINNVFIVMTLLTVSIKLIIIIGTDATHAEHIETIKSRLYVGLENNKYFVPGELGIGLVEGYDNMGFEMSKPYLRAELEAELKK